MKQCRHYGSKLLHTFELMASKAEELLQELLQEFKEHDTSFFPEMDLGMLPEWQILCLTQVFLFLIQVFFF